MHSVLGLGSLAHLLPIQLKNNLSRGDSRTVVSKLRPQHVCHLGVVTANLNTMSLCNTEDHSSKHVKQFLPEGQEHMHANAHYRTIEHKGKGKTSIAVKCCCHLAALELASTLQGCRLTRPITGMTCT